MSIVCETTIAIGVVNDGALRIKKITSANSPYTVIIGIDVIEVTINATDIDILLLPVVRAKRKLLIIRHNTGAGTGTLDVIANGSEKMKEPGGVLIDNKEMDGDGDSLDLFSIDPDYYNII